MLRDGNCCYRAVSTMQKSYNIRFFIHRSSSRCPPVQLMNKVVPFSPTSSELLNRKKKREKICCFHKNVESFKHKFVMQQAFHFVVQVEKKNHFYARRNKEQKLNEKDFPASQKASLCRCRLPRGCEELHYISHQMKFFMYLIENVGKFTKNFSRFYFGKIFSNVEFTLIRRNLHSTTRSISNENINPGITEIVKKWK